jgi:hypothetical protein
MEQRESARLSHGCATNNNTKATPTNKAKANTGRRTHAEVHDAAIVPVLLLAIPVALGVVQLDVALRKEADLPVDLPLPPAITNVLFSQQYQHGWPLASRTNHCTHLAKYNDFIPRAEGELILVFLARKIVESAAPQFAHLMLGICPPDRVVWPRRPRLCLLCTHGVPQQLGGGMAEGGDKGHVVCSSGLEREVRSNTASGFRRSREFQ